MKKLHHKDYVQDSLDYIDREIKAELTVDRLADQAGFSIPHFARVFRRLVGMPVHKYVVRRKLEYARYEIMQGRKILDAAVDYGFETAAGFTKAFKKEFAVPPGVYCSRGEAVKPKRVKLGEEELRKTGGLVMEPKIIMIEKRELAGYEFYHKLGDTKRTGDIPAHWAESGNGIEGGGSETILYETFPDIPHGEYCLCIPPDPESDECVYFLGVWAEDSSRDRPDMKRITIPESLYAVFTTPKVADEKFVESIRTTWSYILDQWLPESDYEYDESRLDFEHHDERCHEWEYPEVCMDIYIPVKLKK